MSSRAPSRDEVEERLRAALEDDSERAAVASWAQQWIEQLGELDEADTRDRAVWRAMVRLVGVNLQTGGAYHDGKETLSAWLDDLTSAEPAR
jgi:hypothetical protein